MDVKGPGEPSTLVSCRLMQGGSLHRSPRCAVRHSMMRPQNFQHSISRPKGRTWLAARVNLKRRHHPRKIKRLVAATRIYDAMRMTRQKDHHEKTRIMLRKQSALGSSPHVSGRDLWSTNLSNRLLAIIATSVRFLAFSLRIIWRM
jgi:hypothetical protein